MATLLSGCDERLGFGQVNTKRPLPLEGIVVLDLGQIYQGPYAGFLLAQSGARVIKIEPPEGEAARVRGPNLAFAMLNTGKECVSIDLKSPEGLAQFKELVRTADVGADQLRPRRS